MPPAPHSTSSGCAPKNKTSKVICLPLSMPITRRRILQAAAFAVSAPMLAEPPSIAALQSMRNRVRPIEAAERLARLERARELMRRYKLDAILLTGGSSLLYFTAARWGQSERFFGTLIPAKGSCLCVCPSFEEGRAREQLERGPLADARVLTWAEDENPYRVLAAGMQSIGLSTATRHRGAHAIRLCRRHRQSRSSIENRKRDARYRRLPHAEKSS